MGIDSICGIVYSCILVISIILAIGIGLIFVAYVGLVFFGVIRSNKDEKNS